MDSWCKSIVPTIPGIHVGRVVAKELFFFKNEAKYSKKTSKRSKQKILCLRSRDFYTLLCIQPFSLHLPHPLLMPAFLAKNATYNVHDVQLL
jgi:hypothetical protein